MVTREPIATRVWRRSAGVSAAISWLLAAATVAGGVGIMRSNPALAGFCLSIAVTVARSEMKDLEDTGRVPTRRLRWPVYGVAATAVVCFLIAAIRHWRP